MYIHVERQLAARPIETEITVSRCYSQYYCTNAVRSAAVWLCPRHCMAHLCMYVCMYVCIIIYVRATAYSLDCHEGAMINCRLYTTTTVYAGCSQQRHPSPLLYIDHSILHTVQCMQRSQTVAIQARLGMDHCNAIIRASLRVYINNIMSRPAASGVVSPVCQMTLPVCELSDTCVQQSARRSRHEPVMRAVFDDTSDYSLSVMSADDTGEHIAPSH